MWLKATQVKLHVDEAVPVTMANRAYCSKIQLEVRYPHHTHWREDGNDK